MFFDGKIGNSPVVIHTRTTRRYNYSYISSAAIRIGEDVLEVASWGMHLLNGISGALIAQNDALSHNVAGFPLSYVQESEKDHTFDIDLGGGDHIVVKAFKDIVSLQIDTKGKNGNHGTGMMGEYPSGKMLARDGGVTILDDPNAFGQEWQVRSTEPNLFQATRYPQYPQVCTLPSPTEESRRRLGTPAVALEEAEKACAHVEHVDICVQDVIATGDLDMANAGVY